MSRFLSIESFNYAFVIAPCLTGKHHILAIASMFFADFQYITAAKVMFWLIPKISSYVKQSFLSYRSRFLFASVSDLNTHLVCTALIKSILVTMVMFAFLLVIQVCSLLPCNIFFWLHFTLYVFCSGSMYP